MPKSVLQMKNEYDNYLYNHINNVKRGFSWICKYAPEIVADVNTNDLYSQLEKHDMSKYSEEEYLPYALYFYGEDKTDEIKQEFDAAWLHHQHCNPHHWQYWCLINDSDQPKINAQDMPKNYIIEMLCDHWSFSWSKGDLTEIFRWVNDNIDDMILSDNTFKIYTNYLDILKNRLIESGRI